MKLTYNEYEHGFWIALEPETPKEVAQCVRMSLNMKAIPPKISTDFKNDTPHTSIYFTKVDKSKQGTSIRPENRK